MSKGGFTAFFSVNFRQTTKNPSQAVPEMGSFGKSFSDQIRNSFPKAHSLLEAPPPDLVELAAVHEAASIAKGSTRRQGDTGNSGCLQLVDLLQPSPASSEVAAPHFCFRRLRKGCS
jgi:hypothetical protein